jgi:hypothetical protein
MTTQNNIKGWYGDFASFPQPRFMEPSYIFAPYIPLQITTIVASTSARYKFTKAGLKAGVVFGKKIVK